MNNITKKINSEELIAEYHKMIKRIVYDYCNRYRRIIDYSDDIIQDSYILLLELPGKFDPSYNVKFSTYAYSCIERQVKSRVRWYLRQTRDQSSSDFQDCLRTYKGNKLYQRNCEEVCNYNDLIKLIKETLETMPSVDKKVMEMRVAGYSYNEISEKLNLNYKQVDYKLCKTRKKIKNVVPDNYFIENNKNDKNIVDKVILH